MKIAIVFLILVSALSLGGCSKENPEANLQNPTVDKPADPTAPPAENHKNVKFGPGGGSAARFGAGH